MVPPKRTGLGNSARDHGSDAGQEQSVRPDFASNVPSENLDQFVAKSTKTVVKLRSKRGVSPHRQLA